MSQLPDKIWLHRDTKYSTADTVCGYQYKFLAENEGIENFVEYIRSDAFIKKVINFLNYKLDDIVAIQNPDSIIPQHIVKPELIEDFKKYIEEYNV